MGYTRMTFLQFHRLAHSHSMQQNDYHFSLSSYGFGCYGTGTPLGGVFEIGFVEENPLVFEFSETKQRVVINVDDIFIIPPNCRVSISALHPGNHKHTSVEFLIDCTTEYLDQDRLSPEDCDSIKGQTLILPHVIPAEKDNNDLVALIRQLARDRMLMVEKNYFEESQAFMYILSAIAARMRRNSVADAVPPSYRRYCQKAKEYIAQHIDHRITINEIAEHLGINKNYLTNIFSSCEKNRLSDYINRVKLNRLRELIVKYNYSIKKASEAVGFYDVNYVSRIFKKYYGITISEYRRMSTQ